MPLTLQTAKFSVKNGRRFRTEYHPYMRLSKDGEHVYIQDGQVYAGGGERVNLLPGWFEEEIKKQSKEGLDEVGWTEHKKVGRPPSKETIEARLDEKAKESKEPEESNTLHLKK